MIRQNIPFLPKRDGLHASAFFPTALRCGTMLDVPNGTLVRLIGHGSAHQRKLTHHGGAGIDYANGGPLTTAEAKGSFTWLGTDGGRYALLRSQVSGREGKISRDLLRESPAK
jgi:hypothetical protein